MGEVASGRELLAACASRGADSSLTILLAAALFFPLPFREAAEKFTSFRITPAAGKRSSFRVSFSR
jgi:hypothetical protein